MSAQEPVLIEDKLVEAVATVATVAAASPVPSPDAVAIAEGERVASYIEPKADIVYGSTDSGKTAQIGLASDYILKKYGMLSRIITADGGGIGPLSGRAKSGQLEVWTISAWKNPVASMRLATQGYWPVRGDDPESPLMPPDAGTWEIYGLVAYETLTSWGDVMLQNLKDEKASLSQDPSYTWTQGGQSFSGGNQSYYGFLQDQLYSFVSKSHLTPTKKVIWTSHEARGEDTEGKASYGPAIAGKKTFKKVPSWFANCVHLDILEKEAQQIEIGGSKVMVAETERVMWLKTHADPKNLVPFPAKVRVGMEYNNSVPKYLFPPSLLKLYELIDELEEKSTLDSRKAMGGIGAVREKVMAAAKIARERQEKAAMAKAVRSTVTVPAMPSVGAMPSMPGRPAVAPTVPTVSPAPVVAAPGSVPTIQSVSKK